MSDIATGGAQEQVAPKECNECHALYPGTQAGRTQHDKWHKRQSDALKELHRLIANVERGNPRRWIP